MSPLDKIVLVASLLILVSNSAAAQDSGAYIDVHAGPAFVTYLRIHESVEAQEHLAIQGRLLDFGAGYGFDLGRARLDLGFRARVFHVHYSGRYDVGIEDDDYLATAYFLAPGVTVGVASRFDSPVDVFGGVTLGTATYVSDRRGESLAVRQIPVFGSFEVGALFKVLSWLELRVALAWIPPVDSLNMLATQLGLRARL